MGSAVSAVTNTLGNLPGSIGSGAGSIISPIAGAAGSSLGAAASGIIGQIGTVPIANQGALQNQIANQQMLSTRGYDLAGSQQQLALENTGTALNQIQGASQQAINNAQNINTGAGSNVSNSLALLQAQANGTAPSAAQAVLQSGKNQAIAAQQALANSGNLSQMISGQKTAMDNAANLTQQSANQATQLQATQQQVGQQAYAGAAAQQASQAANTAGLQQQQANQLIGLTGQENQAAQGYFGNAIGAGGSALGGAQGGLGIQQTALGQTGQNQAMAVGGLLNAAGGAGAAASDENLKTNITPIGKAGAISKSFGTKPAEDSSDSDSDPFKAAEPEKPRGSWSGKEQQDTAKSISASFSDKNGKKDIKNEDKVSAFLDAIDPVSFKYKETDGKMGRTPGEHIGIIAQQVEKAPGGKSMVIDTPIGKGIDLASAVGTLLAAAAETHDRVKDLEDLFNSKKKK